MTIPTTTMYRIRRYLSTITPVEVVRTTKASAYMRHIDGTEYRESLHSTYSEILPTWEEAYARLLQIADEQLAHARRELERANGRRGNIAGMKKPVA